MKPRIARIGPKLLDPQSVIFFRASPLGRFLAGPASYKFPGNEFVQANHSAVLPRDHQTTEFRPNYSVNYSGGPLPVLNKTQTREEHQQQQQCAFLSSSTDRDLKPRPLHRIKYPEMRPQTPNPQTPRPKF
jgi:hypothetical protein